MWRYCVTTLKPYYFGCNCISKYTRASARPFRTLTQMTTITESDVGILCFISQLPGFRGILKQRYSDFIVNEVDTDGNVVHLTSLDAPPEVIKDDEIKISDQISRSFSSEIELFRSLAGDTNADQLEAFLNQITSGHGDDISPITLSPDSDKSHRTAMHNFFKENFRFLVTDTVDGPDSSSKCIRVRLNLGSNNSGRNSKKRKERGSKPYDSRGFGNWPEHLGKFLRFHLYKENKDTQEALGLIGKMLGIQPRSFGFAGTKDKRSVSTQRVTVFKQNASRLAALNERLIGIKVGDFCYANEGLLLGQLLGNRFTITLRGVVSDSEDTISGSADSLGKHGFINYFGLQRFGSGSVPTHLIGAILLRGENVISKVREYYKETGDIDGTLRQLPRHLVSERAILQCLKKCPGNYLQALKAIPRTLRMMYVHSYQSYLWNHAASVRVQKYGTNQVVLGDLVYCKGDDAGTVPVSITSEHEDDTSEDMDNCGQLDEISRTDLPEGRNSLVKAVTAEDINAGNYTIEDVVLPMPGSRVMYPVNEVADVYHDMAKKDNIDLKESVHNVKEFSITSVTGSYRRVFQKPIDFEWELLTYTDGNLALAETDLDKIAKTRRVNMVEDKPTNGSEGTAPFDGIKQSESIEDDLSSSTVNIDVKDENQVEQPENQSLPGSTQMALKLGFTLPSSCYATMAIRELLKTSTSVAFHKTLNQ
ncbi:hypothetical protein SLA2020_073560 [Shorea laevis]